VELLFELLELAKYHLLEKLADAIQHRIITLKVTQENLLLLLNTATQYKHLEGFQDIAENVERKINLAFCRLSSKIQLLFCKEHHEENMDALYKVVGANRLTPKLMLALENMKCIVNKRV